MSTSYDATVVYGFKAEKLSTSTTVTKYNEDTGAPYDKTIQGDDKVFINNVEIFGNDDDEIDSGEIFRETLEVFGAGDCINEFLYIGIDIASVDSANAVVLLPHPKTNDELLKLSKEVGMEPQLFLLINWG